MSLSVGLFCCFLFFLVRVFFCFLSLSLSLALAQQEEFNKMDVRDLDALHAVSVYTGARDGKQAFHWRI